MTTSKNIRKTPIRKGNLARSKKPALNARFAFSKTQLAIVIGLILVIGGIIIWRVLAATSQTEVETWTVSGGTVKTVADNTASSGSYTEFQAPDGGGTLLKTQKASYKNLGVYPEFWGKNPSAVTDPDRSEPGGDSTTPWNELTRFESWLGRPTTYVMQFGNPNPGSWTNMESNLYQIGTNLQSLPASTPKRTPIVTIPLSVGTTPLQDVINGQYDDYFRRIAASYNNKGLGNTIWRLGWEHDTPSWSWSSKDKTYETGRNAKYGQAWSRIRDVMASQSSGFKFSYDMVFYALSAGNGFSGTSTGTNAWKSYPTGTTPDYIGVDVYDAAPATTGTRVSYSIQKDSLGAWPAGTSWAQKRVAVWNDLFGPAVQAASDFAKAKGKPLVIPEWAIGRGDNYSVPSNKVGGDNDYFMTKMLDFIDNPANNVAWHSYFNRYDKTTEGTFKINPLIATNQSWAPNASKVFVDRLGK